MDVIERKEQTEQENLPEHIHLGGEQHFFLRDHCQKEKKFIEVGSHFLDSLTYF